MINTLKNRKCQRHLEKKVFDECIFIFKKPVKYHNNYQ